MQISGQEKFLTYYRRELTYLRQAGQHFAHKHPKIARRLELSALESPDPHTERLLESFAFMTARLHQEIDDRLPQISSALLGILYPQLVSPVPSMSIAQFIMDPSKGKMTSGTEIPKNTPLFTYAEEGVTCQFRTGYPVNLWPIEVVSAEFTQAEEYVFFNCTRKTDWYLKLRLRAIDLDFSDLDLKTLRFYINGENIIRFGLYDIIFAQNSFQVLTSIEDTQLKELPEGSLKQVGFKVKEGLLPAPDHSHPSYQLLHEYFHFPEKFLFFDVDNLHLNEGGEYAEILISLEDTRNIENLSISESNFKLGCTPILNLFHKVTDPLRIDHQKFEYRLVPDQRRERTTEIYSIEKVTLTHDNVQDSEVLIPYFSYDHESYQLDPQVYWLSRRAPSEKREVPGTDIYLSFVDLAFNAKLPTSQIIYAHTLCTNRFLAEQVPAGGLLQVEETYPTSKIVCLMRPTPQTYSPQDGETLWRLVAQLAINHLSISTGDAAVRALKETLRLYAGSRKNQAHMDINAIRELKSSPITRRMGDEAWRGYVNGLHVTLTMDELHHTGESAFLLACVLRHFFTLQASENSFVEIQLNSLQREGTWIKWNPLHGDQLIL